MARIGERGSTSMWHSRWMRSKPAASASATRSRSSKSIIAGCGRVFELVERRLDLVCKVGDGGDVVAPEAVGRLGEHEAVDGFKERDAPAAPQRAMQGGKRAGFVGDVDEHRAGGDHVDRRVGDLGEVLSARRDEPSTIQHAARSDRLAALLQQGSGDVGKDHAAVRSNALESFEADQAVARADIEQGRPVQRLGAAEHAVANRTQVPKAD